ncbi:unnamed protein product [Auanema sp. JU1783]|nr:unnamed protein product [Auanema sp. JU1783]
MVDKSSKRRNINEIIIPVPVLSAFLMFFLILQLVLLFILFSSFNKDFNNFLIVEPLNEHAIQPLNYNSSFPSAGVSFILPINLIVLRINDLPVLIQEMTTEIEICGLHTGFLLIKEDYLISGPRIAITFYPHVKLFGSAAHFIMTDVMDVAIRVKLSMMISINGFRKKYSEDILYNVYMNISLEGFEQIPFKDDDSHLKRSKTIPFRKMLLDIAFIIKIFFALILFAFIYMKLKHELTPSPIKLFLSYTNGTTITNTSILRASANDPSIQSEMLFHFSVELRQPINQTTIIQSIEVHSESDGRVTRMTNYMSSYLFNETSTIFDLSARLRLSLTENRQCFDVDEPDGFIQFATQIFINVGEGKAQRIGFSNKQHFKSCCVRFCTPF